MEFPRPFLLVFTVWCCLDQVHLIPSQINKGSLLFKSLATTSPLEENFRECGKSKKTGTHTDKLSIVGGQNATLGHWPWMVALFEGSPEQPVDFKCGGSLISKQWVITAAHCVYDNSEKFVRLGELNLNNKVKDGAKPIDALIDKIEIYPKFTMEKYIKDIALIRLKKPVRFTDNIRPICLLSGPQYESDQYYKGRVAFITGWGRLAENGEDADILQEASVKVVPPEKCAKQYAEKKEYVIDKNVICAGEKGKSACKGDSGGPLMFLNSTDGRYYLGGIVSASTGCARENYSAVFTKVARYIRFINEVTGGKF